MHTRKIERVCNTTLTSLSCNLHSYIAIMHAPKIRHSIECWIPVIIIKIKVSVFTAQCEIHL